MLVHKRKIGMFLGGLAVAMLLTSGLLVVDLLLFRWVAAEDKAAASPLSKTTDTESCLGCHGPFEQLAKRTAAYVTDHGEKVNPHIYVPHNSTKITTCDSCHTAHPLPVSKPGSIAKANLQYCYSACHHENDFTPCVKCHKDRK